ncbi:MAG: SMC-Scp complex subunit ScpB [Candidatus Tectomicrobia bacterium]|nr:SMC-Scp complex subunit ScpB [Candidatus Tectomicrobia bacterium]
MDPRQAKAIIESLLLVADRPLSALEISKVFDGEVERRQVEALLEELVADYAAHPLQVVAVAGGYRLSTRAAYAPWVRRFLHDARRVKLSRAALETLAVIAYKQPMTKPEIEYLRGGVDAGGVLRTLLERRLIKILGRKQVPGRPAMYGTTQEFLLYFGLRDLTDLPTLQEFIDQAEGGAEEADAGDLGEEEGKESTASLEEEFEPSPPLGEETPALRRSSPAAAEDAAQASHLRRAAEPPALDAEGTDEVAPA